MVKTRLNGFQITELTDATPKVAKPGSILLPRTNQVSQLSFANGVAGAVKKYIDDNTVVAGKAKPVRISIKKLLLNETTINGKSVDGELQIQFGFDLVIGDDLYTHLIDYKGAVRYSRLPNQTGAADIYIRMGIQNSLKFFNDWLDQHKNNDAALANNVRLVFKDYTEKEESDTIYYSPKRPLTWDDFQDKVSARGGYAAEVIPGLGFTESNEVKSGELIVEMRLKVFLPKSAAYVEPGQKNDVNLNHEQRHFDIVKIISNRFKKGLLAQQLPVHNYDGDINVAYFDALRQITAMQKQYDTETRHGMNLGQQEVWNKKIDTELKAAGSGR
ncbi:hypothetical protein [Mucilaginibacter ginkgonis]|uniref:Uncharacterized protein n=1 Tax=Mucilaginibacter ginkgonis TaxID=2682091 RepID=A0A6I4HZQ8_9SPHI|nr:hypothetical protein [Mucilaginibacter ginkgonis]QQL50054.1 hypothetical protein GO620_000970 [Mucilaginibacter ginkgonis]